MYNFIGGNNQAKTEKWLNKKNQGQEIDQENDNYHSYSSKNQPNKSGASSSELAKIINNKQAFSTGIKPTSTISNNLKPNNGSIINNNEGEARSKVFDINVMPKRLALSYTIPTIIIEYLEPKTGKLYHHKIKIRELRTDSDKHKVLNQIKRRHEMYLTKIPDKQILSKMYQKQNIYIKFITLQKDLIENLQKNLKLKKDVNSDKEPEKPSDISNRKEKESENKQPTIKDTFINQKVIADSRLSFEEKELCGKFKNQFEDDEDDFEENDYIGYNRNNNKQNLIQKDNKSRHKQGDDDFEQYEENEYQQGDQEYDYDFDEYSESNSSKNNVQNIQNKQNNSYIKNQQLIQQTQNEKINVKPQLNQIQSQSAQQNSQYGNGQDNSDLYGRKFPKYTSKAQEDDLEESDGHKDFDMDSNAIYQHQFAQKNYSHKIKTQEESQYSDEQEELDENEEGEEYDEEGLDNQDGEDYEEGEGDDYDLEDIENLNIEEQKYQNSIKNEFKQNNYMQSYEKQLENIKEQKQISIEQKQNSEEKLKNVKFEQTLSSKKPEMQIKSSTQQTSSAIGGFVPKKNNYLDADYGLEVNDDEEQNFEVDFQIDFSDVKQNKDDEESDKSEDEDDLYQQVKNKISQIKQKETQIVKPDNKNNIQTKQNDIPINQKGQQNKQLYADYDQAVDLDDDFNDEDYPDGEEDYDEGEEEDQEEGDKDEYELDDIDDQYQSKAHQTYTSSAVPVGERSQKVQQVEGSKKNNFNTQKDIFDDLENELEENLEHLVDYDHLDLNKLDTKELEEHKKKMDKKYEQNRKKPGDPDFVYDVRQHFDPAESNQWDVSQNQDKHDTEEVDYDIV